MNHPIHHLSWSSLSTCMQCSLKWKFHYVEQTEPEFTPAALHFGKAIHSAIATYLQSNLSGESMMPEELMEEYHHAWSNYDGPEIRYGSKDCQESLESKAHNLLRLFHEQFKPGTKVIAIEEPFELSLLKVEPDHM